MSRRVFVQTPSYLPDIEYLARCRDTDVIVLLDDALPQGDYYVNGARIWHKDRAVELSLPAGGDIRMMVEYHTTLIQVAYNGMVGTREITGEMEGWVGSTDLAPLCERGLHFWLDRLGLSREVVRASWLPDFARGGSRTARLAAVCRAVGADEVLVSRSAYRGWLEHDRLLRDGVRPVEHFWMPDAYPGMPAANLSIVDLWCRHGEVAEDWLGESISGSEWPSQKPGAAPVMDGQRRVTHELMAAAFADREARGEDMMFTSEMSSLARRAAILDLLNSVAPLGRHVSVLEVGCGGGAFSALVPRCKRYVAIDANAAFVEEARTWLYGLADWMTFEVARLEEWTIPFDVVIAPLFLTSCLYPDPWPGVLKKLAGLARHALAFDVQQAGEYLAGDEEQMIWNSVRLEEVAARLHEYGFRDMRFRTASQPWNTVMVVAATRV